jgi:hypothetical protein
MGWIGFFCELYTSKRGKKKPNCQNILLLVVAKISIYNYRIYNTKHIWNKSKSMTKSFFISLMGFKLFKKIKKSATVILEL